MKKTIKRIHAIDPSVENTIYEGGCEFLWERYMNKVNSVPTNDRGTEPELHDQVAMDNNKIGVWYKCFVGGCSIV